MTREQIVSYSLLAFLLFIIYQVFTLLSPFVNAIFWAAILVFAFYPFYKKARSALGLGETLASFIFTVLIVLAVIPPMILLVFNITQQAVDLYQWATEYVKRGRLTDLITEIRNLPLLQNIQERIPQWEIVQESLSSWILNTTRSLGNYSAGQVAIMTKNIFFVFLNLFMMIILIFIFLKDGERIYSFLYTIIPLEKKNKDLIFNQLNDTFAAVIRGQFLTSLVQASAAGIVFWMVSMVWDCSFMA